MLGTWVGIGPGAGRHAPWAVPARQCYAPGHVADQTALEEYGMRTAVDVRPTNETETEPNTLPDPMKLPTTSEYSRRRGTGDRVDVRIRQLKFRQQSMFETKNFPGIQWDSRLLFFASIFIG